MTRHRARAILHRQWIHLIGLARPLAIALFNHLSIWVHYYATEKPDMEYRAHA